MQLDKRIQLLLAMEKHFDKHDSIFFEELLKHEDYVIRTRAVCIMAEIAGEKAVELIGNVLLNAATTTQYVTQITEAMRGIMYPQQ